VNRFQRLKKVMGTNAARAQIRKETGRAHGQPPCEEVTAKPQRIKPVVWDGHEETEEQKMINPFE
jgi:hypothetical protein